MSPMKQHVFPSTSVLVVLVALFALAGCGGKSPAALNAQGNEAYAQQDYATALDAYTRAGAEDPLLAEPQYNAASVHYRQSDYEQAGAALDGALAHSGEELAPAGNYNLGNARYRAEDYAGAVEAYKQALRLNPADVDAKVNLELALRKLRENRQEQPPEPMEEPTPEPTEQPTEEPTEEPTEQPPDQPTEEPTEQTTEQPEGTPTAAPTPAPSGTPTEAPQPGGDQPTPTPGTPADAQLAGGDLGDQQATPGPTLLPQQGLTPEQAARLLAATAKDTQSLQEHLQRMYVAPTGRVEKDW
jgi:tetratricopeptide (TPR) repeat protein